MDHYLGFLTHVFSVSAVGLRDYAWTTRYSVLYIDNPVCIIMSHQNQLHENVIYCVVYLMYTNTKILM